MFRLNVGGTIFVTTKETLCKYSNSKVTINVSFILPIQITIFSFLLFLCCRISHYYRNVKTRFQGSIYYIENHIPTFGRSYFPPYIYLQECKNKNIFDYFVLVFEQIVIINFHFLYPQPFRPLFPPPPRGAG